MKVLYLSVKLLLLRNIFLTIFIILTAHHLWVQYPVEGNDDNTSRTKSLLLSLFLHVLAITISWLLFIPVINSPHGLPALHVYQGLLGSNVGTTGVRLPPQITNTEATVYSTVTQFCQHAQTHIHHVSLCSFLCYSNRITPYSLLMWK